MDLGIRDRVALVTGSGQGMGRGIALRLAEEGAHVVVNDVDHDRAKKVAQEVQALGRKSVAVKADVADHDEVRTMFALARQALGPVEILVNNAGVGDGVPFAESKREDWDRAIGVCLYGTLTVTREAIGSMIEKRWGKVVGILSEAGRVGEPNLSAYSAAKAGVLGFTKALAREVGRHRINVNCVAAGATLTDHIRERYAQFIAEKGQVAFDERQKKVLKRYPLGRLGEVEDIASAVAFLCSERASFITGQALSVSGGFSMMS